MIIYSIKVMDKVQSKLRGMKNNNKIKIVVVSKVPTPGPAVLGRFLVLLEGLMTLQVYL